jgi:hypothetical protein
MIVMPGFMQLYAGHPRLSSIFIQSDVNGRDI